MKISFKITLLMVALVVLAVGIIVPVMSVRSWSTARGLGLSLAQTTSHQVAAEMRAYLEAAWYKASTLAGVMSQFESIPPAGRRTFLNSVMRTTLEENYNLVNTWVIWDANMLDGSDLAAIGAPGTDETGRFVPRYTRTLADRSIVPDVARDFHTAPYYVLPRQQGRQIITYASPRLLAGEMRNPISFAAPVRNMAGQIVGIVGVDIGLMFLNIITQDFQRVFEGTMSAAFSNSGRD